MTNSSLAVSYLKKATGRLAFLRVLQQKKAYSDVVREAQEIVELALKGMLRQAGLEPPKWHDVGSLLIEHQGRFEPRVRRRVARLAQASEWLRAERELLRGRRFHSGRIVHGRRGSTRHRRGQACGRDGALGHPSCGQEREGGQT